MDSCFSRLMFIDLFFLYLFFDFFSPHRKQLSNQIGKDYFAPVRFSKFVSLLELWQNVARRCAALVISAHLVVIVKSIIREPVLLLVRNIGMLSHSVAVLAFESKSACSMLENITHTSEWQPNEYYTT